MERRHRLATRQRAADENAGIEVSHHAKHKVLAEPFSTTQTAGAKRVVLGNVTSKANVVHTTTANHGKQAVKAGLSKPAQRVALSTVHNAHNVVETRAAQLSPAKPSVRHGHYQSSKSGSHSASHARAASEVSRTATSNVIGSDDTEIASDDDDVLADSGSALSGEATDIPTTNPHCIHPIHDVNSKAEFLEAAKEIQAHALEWDDEDDYDIAMVTDYSDEIFDYMRELEAKYQPNPEYMDRQTEIYWSMRRILVDWLVQVHSTFNLLPETLFLTINFMDRFLSLKVVSRAKLQLVGVTALFLAAKYEEINCPSVGEVVFMVGEGYSAEEILKAERYMINLLDFQLGWPGPMSFLRRTSKADDYDLETRTLAKYLLEITVMDERFVGAPPSWLAAGAHFLSRHMLNRGDWSQAHIYYSGYTATQLEPVSKVLLEACRNPEEHHKAVYLKYSNRKFKKASLFVAEWMAATYG